MRDVVHRAGDEIIYADDFVAARQKQIRQVRAQKARRARDDGRGLFVIPLRIFPGGHKKLNEVRNCRANKVDRL
jgi:hypothetical protein